MESQTVEEAVIAVQQLFWAALKTRDQSLFEQVLAPQFNVIWATRANQPRAVFIETFMEYAGEILSINGSKLEVYLLDNVAVLTGIQIAQLKLPDQRQITDVLAITNIFQQSEGKWQMILAHPVEIALET